MHTHVSFDQGLYATLYMLVSFMQSTCDSRNLQKYDKCELIACFWMDS